MGNETATKPKCFTILDGKRLLDWQFQSLRGAGVNDISVVTGYKAEMFKGDFHKYINKRWSETNMVASLFCADAFTGNTIISYSDIVYKKEHIDNLNLSEAEISINADRTWAN